MADQKILDRGAFNRIAHAWQCSPTYTEALLSCEGLEGPMTLKEAADLSAATGKQIVGGVDVIGAAFWVAKKASG
jgi:hypothetical protein